MRAQDHTQGRANFAIAAGLSLIVALCTVSLLAGGCSVAPGANTEDQRALYVQRLEVAKTAYNGVVDAYTIAFEAGLLTDAERDLIDPYGQAAEGALRTAAAAMEVWVVAADPGDRLALDAALSDLTTAVIELGAQWRAVKP